MKWKIGNVEIKNQVVLAPMADVSNSAFRTIAKEMGAGLVVAEMVPQVPGQTAMDGTEQEAPKLLKLAAR